MFKEQSFLALATGALLVVTFFVGLPAIIISSNVGEFSSPFLNILESYWMWAAALFALLLIPSIALPQKASRIWASLVAVLAIYTWLHGVFQTHDFGPMDGQNWSATVPVWQVWVEAAVIVTGAVLLFAMSSRFPKAVAFFALVLTGGMLLQSWPVITKSEWKTVSDKVLMPDLAKFSGTKNALVVLMDSMNSDVFEQVVRENPEIAKDFEGFTLFPDTAGASPTTYLAMPTIHSGRVYQQGVPLRQFFTSSVKENSVLTKVANAGYDSLIVNPILDVCPKDLTCVRAGAGLKSKQGEVRSDGIAVLDAALFRIAPLALKEAVHTEGKWLLKSLIDDKRFVQTGIMHNFFLEELARSLTVGLDRPSLKFVHLLNTHAPSVYTPECTYAGGRLERNRENYLAQVRCSLRSFGALIKALKEKQIFDQTAIILLADHGNLVVPSARTSMQGVKTSKGIGVANIIGVANPTFAVKPFGAKGAFRTAGGEIHLSDFGATLCDLLKDCSVERGVSALMEPTGRVRQFNFYRWKDEFWSASALEMTPYEIHGPLVAERNWRRDAPIKIGETINFGDKGAATPYMWSGFSLPEPIGTWTSDKVATLAMNPGNVSHAQVQLHATGFVAGGPVRVSVAIGETQVGEMLFDEKSREGNFTFPIPEGALQDGSLKIDFVISEPKSPASLGLSKDTRPLGFLLHSLKLAPQGG